MTSFNWRKGLMRLWLVCASVWLFVAPFWTKMPDELLYAYRYFVERDALRHDLIAGGACAESPYEESVRKVLGLAPKPAPKPGGLASAAMEACEVKNRTVRLYGNGTEMPKEDCLVVFQESLRREERAYELEQKRQAEQAKRESVEAEKRCNEEFRPESPKFQATLFVLSVPTLGIAAAILMTMGVVSVFRWVRRGFTQS